MTKAITVTTATNSISATKTRNERSVSRAVRGIASRYGFVRFGARLVARRVFARASQLSRLLDAVPPGSVVRQNSAKLVQPLRRVLEYAEDGVAVGRLERHEAVAAALEPAADTPGGGERGGAAVGDERRDERAAVVVGDGTP
jgi:hypothetical protein